jgi:hypothetical protein
MRRAFTILVVAGVIAGTTTAAAGETSANRHALSPRSGRADTIFTLRYVSQGADTDAGDQLYLYGPQHTGCRGLIVQDSVGDAPGRQVVRFGFKRGEPPWLLRPYARPQSPNTRPLHRWCSGYYHGVVVWECASRPSCPDVVAARFFFLVRQSLPRRAAP